MKKIREIFGNIYAGFFVFLVLSIILVDKRIKYFSPLKCSMPNFFLFLIGFAICLIFCVLGKKIKTIINIYTTRECYLLLTISGMVIYLIQTYIIYNTYYQAGWDCGTIAEMSEKIARGELFVYDDSYYSYYLSQNPHQAFMVFVLTIIKKISNHFGIQDMYFFSVMIGTLGVTFSCILITLSVKNIKGRYYAFWTFIFSVLFLALSPQSSVPYTDIYAMFLTSLILYLYTSLGNITMLKWFEIGIISFMGYHVKATTIICFIAIVICEILKCDKSNWLRRVTKGIILLFISSILSNTVAQYGNNYIGFVPDKAAEFTPAHYAMMGLNEPTTGVWYGEDVNYSASFDNVSDRQKGNLKVIFERLKEKGIFGLLLFEYKKLIMNYNDGTFFYGKEGGAVTWRSEAPNHTASKLLRKYYFGKSNDEKNYIMNHVLQTEWITVLVLAMLAAVSFRNKITDTEFVITITIVGITLFTLMFEGRSRYLILYTPYFLVLSVIGFGFMEENIHHLYHNVHMRWGKR